MTGRWPLMTLIRPRQPDYLRWGWERDLGSGLGEGMQHKGHVRERGDGEDVSERTNHSAIVAE